MLTTLGADHERVRQQVINMMGNNPKVARDMAAPGEGARPQVLTNLAGI
ncbi:hypothetical protein N752_20315 [Desulforamulus aquiferis]|nr:hypothetical protein N752_20315 [Desulforamulus aquiferis]